MDKAGATTSRAATQRRLTYQPLENGFVIRLNPLKVIVASQPGELFFGIVPSVEFYLFNGLFERASLVDESKQFFVSHRVQRVQMSIG